MSAIGTGRILEVIGSPILIPVSRQPFVCKLTMNDGQCQLGTDHGVFQVTPAFAKLFGYKDEIILPPRTEPVQLVSRQIGSSIKMSAVFDHFALDWQRSAIDPLITTLCSVFEVMRIHFQNNSPQTSSSERASGLPRILNTNGLSNIFCVRNSAEKPVLVDVSWMNDEKVSLDALLVGFSGHTDLNAYDRFFHPVIPGPPYGKPEMQAA